jgi:hypothetical protein
MTSSPSRHTVYCALAWLLCSGLCFVTAAGVAVRYGDRGNVWHHYEYLVDGFLDGHTYLSRAPSPELLKLKDPYDHTTNGDYRLWDASLYHGKYYLYYGPAPAVLAMLPWKLLGGGHLPQWAATAGFAIAGLGALAALLAGVARKIFPAARPGHLFLAVVLVGHVSWLPVVLRRPAFWELPTVAAAALFWWSLFFLWKFHTSRRRDIWAFAGGTALAFTLASRPSYLLGAAVVALAYVGPWLGRRPLRQVLRPLAAVALPLLIGGIGLLAYNYARFGRLGEFGNSYQLWGGDERRIAHFNPAHLWFNFRLYFFSIPELSPYFPFLRTVPVEPLPADYIGVEEMPGLLFTVPALLLGVAAFRPDRTRTPAALRVLLLAATAASAVSGLLLFCFAGACSRYIVELSAGWTVVVGVGCLAFFSAAQGSPPGRALRFVAALAIAWTFAGVWLASFEFRSYARITQPWLYRPLAHFFDRPSAAFIDATGRTFGPVALDIRLAPTFTPGDTTVLSTGRTAMRNFLVLERLAPDKIRLRLVVNELVMIVSPVLQTAGSLIHVELHTPWLYPPTAHPYWDRFTDTAQRRRLQTVSVLATDAVTLMHAATTFFDATGFEPYVRLASDRKPGGAWIEKLRRLDPEKSVAGRDLGADQPEPTPEAVNFPH